VNVFLSYAAADRELAAEVAAGLQDCGHRVWSDDTIPPGQSFSGAMAVAMREADAFVFLLTKGYARGEWARLESGVAIASGRRVIPVVAEAGAEIPPLLRDLRALDLTDPRSRAAAIARLCRSLEQPVAPVPLQAGIEAVGAASQALHVERERYDAASRERDQGMWRGQVLVAIIVVIAAAVVLAGLATDSIVVVAALAALAAGLAAVIGFRLGAARARDRR